MFLIIVGGSVETELEDVGGGVMKWFDTPVTDPNITMAVELGKIIHYVYHAHPGGTNKKI